MPRFSWGNSLKNESSKIERFGLAKKTIRERFKGTL